MIYFCLLILAILIFRLISLKFKKNGEIFFFVLSAICVVAFQGLRSYFVGTDTQVYINSFIEIGKHISLKSGLGITYQNFEIGFIVFNKILFMLHVNERLFLIIVSAIVQLPIFYTIYKYSDSPLLSVLTYFSLGNFFVTFSALRQSISMALCFYGYHFIKKKKILLYVITVLLAALFHKSALFCLILYPLYRCKVPMDCNLVFTSIIIVLCFVFRRQIFSVFSLIYYSDVAMRETGSYMMFAAFFILYLISYIFANERNADFVGLRQILFLITLIYVFASVHDYVTRVSFPMSLYLTIFIPKVVNYACTQFKRKKVIKFLSYAFLLGCYFAFCGSLNTLPFSFL